MTKIPEKIIKVSVCVVTFNQETYIRKCLQSIVNQNVDFEYEIIVGEDCSTDRTRGIVQEFQQKYPGIFRAILHKSNVGVFDNYRSVHFAAKGEYIAHLDGDDFWEPDKLRSQVDFMEQHKDCAAVYTNAWVQTDLGEIIGVFSSGVKKIFDISYLIQKGNFLTHSSMMYRGKFSHSVIPALGDFVDFLLHIRLAKCGQLGFIEKNLVLYTYQSTTSIILQDTEKIKLLIWDAFQEINLPKTQKKILENAKFNFITEVVLIAILHGSFKKIPMWISLLSKGVDQNFPSLTPRLVFSTTIAIYNNIVNLFHILTRKIRGHRILYRK